MSNQFKSNLAEVINNNSGIMIKDQKIQDEFQSDKINELIKHYGNKKTNVNLKELLTPSIASRAKTNPRPLNPFIIFRRNFSRGLKLADKSLGTGPTSKLAAKQWNELSEVEKSFWKKLSDIAKENHKQSYPGYKYNPIKIQEKTIRKTKELINLNDIIEKIKSPSDVIKNDSFSEIHPNIDDQHPITELVDNFYDYEPMEIDPLQYNPQDFFFQPTDSILFQNEISNDMDLFNSLIDPTLLNYLDY